MRLLVLYGTQTGCAQDVAETVGRQASARRIPVSVQGMDMFNPEALPAESVVVWIVSTTGQGDIPDNMKDFWKFLLRRGLPSDWLSGLQYGVFGLGDSSYAKYNMSAKKLDARIAALGARPILPRGLGDDQHPQGYDAALDPWLDILWVKLAEIVHPLPEEAASNSLSSKFIVDEDVKDGVARPSENGHEGLHNVGTGGGTWCRQRPYHARLLVNRRLTAANHDQDVRHFELDTSDSGISYEPGDLVAIQPRNMPEAASVFLSILALDPSRLLRFRPTLPANAAWTTCSLQNLVEEFLDIGATPRRSFFELLAPFATEERERERLLYFASAEGREDMYDYNNRSKKTYTEVFQDFPSARPPLRELLELIPFIQPRYFSISSSPKAHGSRLHVTAAVVRYLTRLRKVRKGLCTTWLTSLQPGALVPIWTKRGSLIFPADLSRPVILVGPGTGCAPFRSLVYQGAALRAEGVAVGPIYLFFGNRKAEMDYLYKDEWELLQRQGVITALFLAFSRDQDHKIYVQHRLKENAGLVWNAIHHQSAYVFVSGSAKRMPTDVHEALQEIVQSEGGLSQSEAAEYIRSLEQQRRYQVEAWS